MLIIRYLNLNSVQSWTFLKDSFFFHLGQNYSEDHPPEESEESLHLQNMIRNPSKIAKCISKTLPENLQRYQKAMQTSQKKHLNLNAKHVSVGVVFSCLFRSFKFVLFHSALRGQTTVNLTFSFCDKIQSSRQFERDTNMPYIRTSFFMSQIWEFHWNIP